MERETKGIGGSCKASTGQRKERERAVGHTVRAVGWLKGESTEN